MMTSQMKRIVAAGSALSILIVGGLVFVWSGLYDIGADDHHARATAMMLDTLRDRSIATHSRNLVVPNLDDPKLVLKGAWHYSSMCTGCHLAPGMKDSEMRSGLYPQPPNLSRMRIEPRIAFWVIKHGIKMSAMPAWGFSHDDNKIWSIVAFLQKLPDLTPAQYKDIVAKAPPDEDEEMDMDAGGDMHHPQQAAPTPDK